MLYDIDPIESKSWNTLSKLSNIKLNLKNLFENDKNRFEKYSISFKDKILFDFSKNLINEEIFEALIELANEAKLSDAIEAMFRGEEINRTQKRAVLHTALRDRSSKPIYYRGRDIKADIQRVLSQMERFCNNIHSGEFRGYSGEKITDIVNIGIGGSSLGPQMVVEALKAYQIDNINIHFVSNIDPSDIYETLKGLNPKTTLFIVSSKTFTTQETITNAKSAKEWFLKSGALFKDIKKHFIAVSTNKEAVKAFGIEEIFEFWDWVGGRYSLWSAIGISIALSIGYDRFVELLEGAYDIDCHFRETPFNKNIPVVLALLGIWYNNFKDAQSYAILPYEQYLHKFPLFLQQLDMESNGKMVSRLNQKISWQSAQIVWGEVGTNAQHSFFQLLHQGTKVIPCDFIASANTHHNIGKHHNILLSNFFAQSEALAFGKSEDEVVREYEKMGLKREDYQDIIPHKIFEGNRPSNSILLNRLTPYTLGALIAIYEHKVFTQGVIWNIYSFDQWGVELGKALAKNILPNLEKDKKTIEYDSSTNGLINRFKKWRQK